MGSKFWSQARALESLMTSQVFLLKEGKIQSTVCKEVSDSRDGATAETVKWSTWGKEEEGYHIWSTSYVCCVHCLIVWEPDSSNQNNFSYHLLSWAPSPNWLTYMNSLLIPHANSAQDVLLILGLFTNKDIGGPGVLRSPNQGLRFQLRFLNLRSHSPSTSFDFPQMSWCHLGGL